MEKWWYCTMKSATRSTALTFRRGYTASFKHKYRKQVISDQKSTSTIKVFLFLFYKG